MSPPGKLLKQALHFSLWSCFIAAYLGSAHSASHEVRIKIGTILASNQSDEIDPRLAPIRKQFKAFKYRSYRLMKEESQTVPWRADATFKIPGGRTLIVSPQEFRDKQISLKIHLEGGEKLDTTVRLQNKGNFILGGPAHEGGVLILSISATTQ
ncbi:MAG: hypothetical protein ACREQ7_10275 [Candidatus Binatia bacterium]